MTRAGWKSTFAGLALVSALMVIAPAVLAAPHSAAMGAAQPSVFGPFFASPFTITRNSYSFGQAPSWAPGDRVLSGQLDSAGVNQVYRSRFDGSAQQCLTCRSVEGPSGFPQERPQADWIMFESYGAQPTHTGNPGFGGYGGDIYVMHTDGSHPYRLTTTSDPGGGVQFTAVTGVPYDNFHAYWSPNGKQVIWTHTEAQPLTAGGETWSIMLGDFVVRNGVPSLRNVRVVAKPYGAYETQPWVPDGTGFLFSAAGGLRSPYQATNPGWGHMQLYFMRLYGRGASPADPQVTQISDDTPAYQEQAIMTPDMKTVIMMSNRSAPQGSWYDAIVSAAMRAGFDAPNTGATQTLQFLSDFIGPDFDSDLYAVDVRTKAIRQLTAFHGVVPEFYWNRGYTKIIFGLGVRGPTTSWQTWTASFHGITASERQVSAHVPAPGLYGQPVAMGRVGTQAQTVRDPGPTGNTSGAAPVPRNPAPAFPHAARSADKPSIPVITAAYLAVWLADLMRLYGQSGGSYLSPPLLGAVSQFG